MLIVWLFIHAHVVVVVVLSELQREEGGGDGGHELPRWFVVIVCKLTVVYVDVYGCICLFSANCRVTDEKRGSLLERLKQNLTSSDNQRVKMFVWRRRKLASRELLHSRCLPPVGIFLPGTLAQELRSSRRSFFSPKCGLSLNFAILSVQQSSESNFCHTTSAVEHEFKTGTV